MRVFQHSRRDLIMLLLAGVAAAKPFRGRAQQSRQLRRVGVLMGRAENDPEARVWIKAFLDELNQLGWVEGQNIGITYRWSAADSARVQRQVNELLATKPDVILGATTPVIAALQKERRSIPIVFVNISDPVTTGFVNSLDRPGGRITGFTDSEDLTRKWVELLKEIDPRITRVLGIYNPEANANRDYIRSFEEGTSSLGVQTIALPVLSDSDIDDCLAAFAREPGGGVVVMGDVFTSLHREAIIKASLRNRLPAIFWARIFVTEGGLLSYGIDAVDPYRRAASYVDRILRGANARDLPVQRPTKFELAINLQTARALGLTVPPTLLARADEVIE